MITKIKDFFSSGLNMNITGFQTRQKVLLLFVGVALVFLVFYWTALVIDGQKMKAQNYATDTQVRLADVQRFIAQRQSSQQESRTLATGLLSHVQGMKQRYGLNGELVNIRLANPAGAATRQEQVTFRAENLVYQEFTSILNDLEQYDNVWVKSVNVSKRFDNPSRIDVAFDVIRGEL